MARSGAEVLKVTGLTAGYGPLRVLHEIDFKVAEGERDERGAKRRGQNCRQAHGQSFRRRGASTASRGAAPV